MPNPDFTGTVPARRCETCKSWHAWPTKRWGSCDASSYHMTCNNTTASMVSLAVTTDLTVCSDWTCKAEAEAE